MPSCHVQSYCFGAFDGFFIVFCLSSFEPLSSGDVLLGLEGHFIMQAFAFCPRLSDVPRSNVPVTPIGYFSWLCRIPTLCNTWSYFLNLILSQLNSYYVQRRLLLTHRVILQNNCNTGSELEKQWWFKMPACSRLWYAQICSPYFSILIFVQIVLT